ncbi:MAG: 23S rRNA (uracil(1939)-C(5))-methyltransferase RlmD [Idiomarina sp.]|nr:23S rRNA (uracil(1939)-C(5))-methyltransferase RlmD [Idiomarina sp.]
MPSLFDRRKGFRPQVKKTKSQTETPTTEHWVIERLSHDGRGVVRNRSGKTVFVEGALPGESVRINVDKRHARFDEATTVEVLNPSESRIEPACPHFSSCGGCQLQHLQYEAQISYKEAMVKEHMAHIGQVDDLPMTSPLALRSHQWHYRRRARLSVKLNKKKQPEFGFRARSSDALVAVEQCPVLEPTLSNLIQPLRALILQLEDQASLGHLELLLNDEKANQVTPVIVVRVTSKLSAADQQLWLTFAQRHACRIIVQDNPTDQDSHFHELGLQADEPPQLNYRVHDDTLRFGPGEFIQVNPHVNELMVKQALEWLDLSGNELVLELFAGFGNFSVPVARNARSVIAIEGADLHVLRGNENAQRLGLNNLKFLRADLNEPWHALRSDLNNIDVLLLDPPRAGAAAVLADLSRLKPSKILYVSCNPATLARDAQTMLQQGYKLEKLCMMDMFAQTAHAEAMALFTTEHW